MNRDGKLQTTLLNVLSDWGKPMDEALLNSMLDVQLSKDGEPETESQAEFRLALKKAAAEGWIDKVDNPRRGPRWFITDLGEAERLK